MRSLHIDLIHPFLLSFSMCFNKTSLSLIFKEQKEICPFSTFSFSAFSSRYFHILINRFRHFPFRCFPFDIFLLLIFHLRRFPFRNFPVLHFPLRGFPLFSSTFSFSTFFLSTFSTKSDKNLSFTLFLMSTVGTDFE